MLILFRLEILFASNNIFSSSRFLFSRSAALRLSSDESLFSSPSHPSYNACTLSTFHVPCPLNPDPIAMLPDPRCICLVAACQVQQIKSFKGLFRVILFARSHRGRFFFVADAAGSRRDLFGGQRQICWLRERIWVKYRAYLLTVARQFSLCHFSQDNSLYFHPRHFF